VVWWCGGGVVVGWCGGVNVWLYGKQGGDIVITSRVVTVLPRMILNSCLRVVINSCFFLLFECMDGIFSLLPRRQVRQTNQ
jgi:hypothetical protein